MLHLNVNACHMLVGGGGCFVSVLFLFTVFLIYLLVRPVVIPSSFLLSILFYLTCQSIIDEIVDNFYFLKSILFIVIGT